MRLVRTSGAYGPFPVDCECEPSPSVCAGGLGGVGHSQYAVERGGVRSSDSGKPPYRVPLMAEIMASPFNGLTVASTFSGAGGSCTGYRMAGFRVAWANEFVPAAQDSYRANHPETWLDPRDIKTVAPEEILARLGMVPGELDLFDGSPPCQAFSTAGKREKGWGKGKRYEHGAVQKNETLFTEYIRLVRGLRPKVFIAENVSGLIKGTAKGYFLEILRELKACGYRVEAKLMDAKWLGVPQSRQRVFFQGVREDLGVAPAWPSPLPYFYSVRDAMPWVGEVASDATEFGAGSLRADAPAPTVSASMQSPYGGTHVRDRVEIIVGNDAFESRWGAGRPAHPTVMAGGPDKQGGFVRESEDDGLVGVQEGNGHNGHAMSEDGAPSPAVMAGRTVAGRTVAGRTRKLTIAEVKRICSFPDDYVLTGSYAQQWERLGNSVPPVMMFHLATAIRDRVFGKSDGSTPEDHA